MIIQTVQDILMLSNTHMGVLIGVDRSMIAYRKDHPELLTIHQLRKMAAALKRVDKDTPELFTLRSPEGVSHYTLRQFVEYLQEDFPTDDLRVVENTDST
jgi:hypothetical protein